ncbi:hypothetical protein [Ornithinibacillus xuwenensis]|uniref:Uncharacterized protein n=1 Tax=Ornithinibacillus xuwenensis TaxID=3144668 RepID=A0ABU9XF93_9BACI
MSFDIIFNNNLIEVLGFFFAIVVIFYFATRINRGLSVKPKAWKIFVVIVVGIFSFSITLTFNMLIKIPLLPLGVWLLYFVLRSDENRWRTYRKFAWLGFWSNFLFLLISLVTIPIFNFVYPKDDLTTYLANIENTSIHAIHPSGESLSLDRESLQKQIPSMTKEEINSDQWYNDTYLSESSPKEERFPYQLIGALPKWGSSLNVMILIEDDGKGILITTTKEQQYFRSDKSLLEGGE